MPHPRRERPTSAPGRNCPSSSERTKRRRGMASPPEGGEDLSEAASLIARHHHEPRRPHEPLSSAAAERRSMPHPRRERPPSAPGRNCPSSSERTKRRRGMASPPEGGEDLSEAASLIARHHHEPRRPHQPPSSAAAERRSMPHPRRGRPPSATRAQLPQFERANQAASGDGISSGRREDLSEAASLIARHRHEPCRPHQPPSSAAAERRSMPHPRRERPPSATRAQLPQFERANQAASGDGISSGRREDLSEART